MDFKQIFQIFDKQKYLAVMAYQEKIIYTNPKFQELTGFTPQEIAIMSPEEILVPDKNYDNIKQAMRKRLKGEDFSASYGPIEIKNSYNKRIFIKFCSQTIQLSDRSYAGLVSGFDLTGEMKKEFLIDILKEINQTIISKETESEIYQKIVTYIHKRGKYEFVCASIKEPNSVDMDPRYCVGNYDKDFLDFLKQIFKVDPKYAHKCMATKCMLNNQFMLVNDITKINFPNKKLIETLLKQNFKSILFFPIFKNDKLYSAIGICSKYIDDFGDTSISIFQEAKQDIEFALKKIENIAYLKLLQEALDKTYSWVVITDEYANILYANHTVEKVTGYKLSELIGKNPNILKSGYHTKEFYRQIWEQLQNNQIAEVVMVNKDKNGKIFYLKDKLIPLQAPNEKKYYISLAIDITHEKSLQNKLKKDILTGLPNRHEFINMITKTANPKKDYTCIIIDIKDFKILNQLNGNSTGDLLLKKFADFIKMIFYDNDIVARIGGDEFGVFIQYQSMDDLYAILHKIIKKTKQIKDFKKISINIGVSLYPKDSQNISELIEKTFLALEIAKEQGDYTYEFFNPQINQKIMEYSSAKKIITNALQNQEFIYHFQPYVDAQTYKVVGAETLLRVKHKEKLIYPDAFINFAEKSGYIMQIEKLMFPKFLKYLKKADIPLSFNLSGKSLTNKSHIKNLFDNIQGLPLVVELTEREIAGNIEYTKKIFNYFKEKEFKLSIDDFGTGYSSLRYLKDLPTDYIKIDISFVKNIEHNYKDLAIVETIINFAHRFDLKTIAEGVETKNQAKILQELKCDYFQGYYFAKPMPFKDLLKFIKKNS